MTLLEVSVPLHPQVEAGFCVVEKKTAPGLCTLSQVHGADGFEIREESSTTDRAEGDYLWTRSRKGIGVFVADCTAILVYANCGGMPSIAAIHAGWRGTAKGVIEAALENFKGATEIHAWMSPSICQQHYEVGLEVIEGLGPDAKKFAVEHQPKRFLLDLAGYQRSKLKNLGVNMKASSLCTYHQPDFVSYRKSSGKLEARQLAWIRLR